MKSATAFAVIILGSFSISAQQYLPKKSSTTLGDMQQSFSEWKKNKDLNSTKGWKWYKRWEDHWSQRTPLSGEAPDLTEYYQAAEIVAAKKKQMAESGRASNWSPVGPNILPPSPNQNSSHGMGRINCITFHPSDPLTFWVGISQGGIWKTTDGGQSYTPLGDDLPIMRISDIALDPNDVNTIYASVGDYAYLGIALWTDDRKRHTHYGMGVYKTTDGGASWNPTGLTYQTEELDASLIRRVFVDSTNSNHILAAGIPGIWKSIDGGSNWTQVLDTMIWDIEQDPSDPNVMYASAAFIENLADGTAGVMKSSDFGSTWTWLSTPIPQTWAAQRIEISVAPSDPNYVYALACDLDGGYYGCYLSIDGGLTWNIQSDFTAGLNPLAWSDGIGQQGGQGTYDLTLLVDPNDRDKLYIGGVNVWASVDGGVNWSGCSYWTPQYGPTVHADQHQLKYNSLDSMYYLCDDGGLFRTDTIKLGSWFDAQNIPGYQWPTAWENLSSGMQITSFYRLGTCRDSAGHVIAGAQDNSTFLYDGNNWINIIGGDGMECLIHPSDPNTLVGSSQYGSFTSSFDGGQNTIWGFTWAISENGEWTTPMIMDPNDPNTLYVGYENLHKTSTFGGFWQSISSFPNMPAAGFPNIHSAIALCKEQPDNIYIAKRVYHGYNAPSELWMTPDGGGSWSDITMGLPDSLYPTYIAVDDDDPLTAWVCYSGFVNGAKVYKTIDAGQNWTNVSYNLPNIPVNCVIHHTGSLDNTLYLGTDLGVYYMNDTLSQWQLYSTNLPNVIVSELELHEGTNKLYAATFGRGIWITDALTPAIGLEDVPIYNVGVIVYPNPSSGQFTLQLEGLHMEQVDLQVVDVMGKVVHEEQLGLSGLRYKQTFDIDLSAGMYFARLVHKNTSKSVKFMVE